MLLARFLFLQISPAWLRKRVQVRLTERNTQQTPNLLGSNSFYASVVGICATFASKKTALHTARKRNRWPRSKLQQAHSNISSAWKRNRRKSRGTLQSLMERHRSWKPNCKHNAWKRKQPKNLQNLQQTSRNAQRIPQRKTRSLQSLQGSEQPETLFRKIPKESNSQFWKSQDPTNNLPHPSTLESNNRIPQNQRHTSCYAIAGT